mgnify:CR=1 FL=1
MNDYEKPTSGLAGPGSKYVKKDINSRNQDHHDTKLTTKQHIQGAVGLIIFIAVFIILIPLGMYKLGFVTLAKLYFVNTDLIATIISFDKGPFRNIFKYLYNDTGPFIGYISQTLINWSVLIGLFALVLHEYKKGHISAPLSKVAFILLITYLLPGRYLIKLQEEYYRYAGGRKMFNGYDITGIKAIILGFLILILLISFEDFCIHKFAKYVQKIIHRIIKFIN